MAVARDPARPDKAKLANQSSRARILPEAFAVFCCPCFPSMWSATTPGVCGHLVCGTTWLQRVMAVDRVLDHDAGR